MAEIRNMEKSFRSLSSEGKATKEGSSRRNSMGNAITKPGSSSASREEKVLPNYLRVSTSSCHDFCKYGGRHTFESKETHSVLFRKKGSAGKQDDNVFASSVKNRKQKPRAKLMASSPNLQIGSSPKIVSDSSKKDLMEYFPVPGGPGGSGDRVDKLMVRTVSEAMDDKEAKQSGSSSPFNSPAHGSGNFRFQKHRSKMRAASKPPEEIQSYPKATLVSKQDFSTESPLSNVLEDSGSTAYGEATFKDIEVSEIKEIKKADPSTNSLSLPIQDQGTAGLKSKKYKVKKPPASSPPQKLESPSKSLSASNRKPLAAKAPISNLSDNSGGKTNGHRKAKYAAQIKEKGEVRSSAPSFLNSPDPRNTRLGSQKQSKTDSLSPSPFVSGLKPTKCLEKKGFVSEKKARAGNLSSIDGSCIETEEKIMDIGDRCEKEPKELSQAASSSSSVSIPSSPSSSSSSSSSLEEDQKSQFTNDTYEHDEMETENGQKNSGQGKGRPRSGDAVQPQEKEHEPHQLKFRRGKVINVESENDGPRRMRFRQGRVVENQEGKGEVGRRNLRKKRSPAINRSQNAGHVASAVVLRHQDVQAKKDAQDFNRVIEETANKLVQSRKGKVKALVGAFETVISLQEAKSTISC